MVKWFLGGFYPTLGASGAIFGLLLAFGMIYPREKVFFILFPVPIPAWLFVTLYAIAELVFGVTGTQAGVAHFAHLGGYLGAWLYLIWMERRSPSRQWKAKIEQPVKKVEIGNWRTIDTK